MHTSMALHSNDALATASARIGIAHRHGARRRATQQERKELARSRRLLFATGRLALTPICSLRTVHTSASADARSALETRCTAHASSSGV